MITFKIPLVPPSVNSLYNVMFALRRVELKPEARVWKSRAKEFIPPITLNEEKEYTISISVNTCWLYKNGKRKKADVHNMAKLIQDTVAEKIGFDDSIFKKTIIERIHNDRENFVTISIQENGTDNVSTS